MAESRGGSLLAFETTVSVPGTAAALRAVEQAHSVMIVSVPAVAVQVTKS